MELVHQLLDEVAGEGDEEGVADDRQLGQHLHDREPDTWMFGQVMWQRSNTGNKCPPT